MLSLMHVTAGFTAQPSLMHTVAPAAASVQMSVAAMYAPPPSTSTRHRRAAGRRQGCLCGGGLIGTPALPSSLCILRVRGWLTELPD